MSDRPWSSLDPGTEAIARAPVGVGPARDRPAETDALCRIRATIEAEIVPRLMLALSASRRSLTVSRAEVCAPDGADVEELARLLLAHDVPVVLEFVEMLRQRGAASDRICLDLLAPSARHLGRLWEQRQCDFEQLKRGLERLRSVLNHFSARLS
jgi:hypothetical protein